MDSSIEKRDTIPSPVNKPRISLSDKVKQLECEVLILSSYVETLSSHIKTLELRLRMLEGSIP